MNKHCFTSIRKSFWSRFIKPFIGGCLFFLVVVFITKCNKLPLNEAFSICAAFSIIGAIVLSVKFYNVIEEVQIVDEKIIFIGHRFNARWEKELDINEAKIQIVSKGNGRGNVDYYLKISFTKDTYSVNRAFTW